MRQPHRTGVASTLVHQDESGQLYRAIFTRLLRNDLVGLILLNRQTGLVEECNRKFAEFFGRLPSALIGRHVSHFEPFFAGREQFQHLLVTWATGAPLRNVRISSARPDGSQRHGVLTVESLPESDGGSLDVALLADISDQARLEEQLRQSERLERIGRLAGEVADEVQAQMKAIDDSAGRLDAAVSAPQRAADEIKRAAARATAIVSILIPGDLAEAADAPVPLAHDVPRITGTETILCIEPDSPSGTAASFLRHLGYRVVHGTNEVDARRQVESSDTKIDLVIALQPAPGPIADLVDELRARRAGLPAILVSDGSRGRKLPRAGDEHTIVLSGSVALPDLALVVRRALTSAAVSPRD